MNDTVPIIPLHDVILDEPTVDQLFFDIAHAGELIAVMQKGLGARRGHEAAVSLDALDQAHHAFTAREIAAVQLRYRFGGVEWWDTLTRTDQGVRLIRINHTHARET